MLLDDVYTPEILEKTCSRCGAEPGSKCSPRSGSGKSAPPHAVRRGVLGPETSEAWKKALPYRCPFCKAEPGDRCVTVNARVLTRYMKIHKPVKLRNPHKMRLDIALYEEKKEARRG